MVKLGIILGASAVIYCAILYDSVGAKKAMSVAQIPKTFYPKLKKICEPEEMKKFIECIKNKTKDSDKIKPADVDAVAVTLNGQKTCELMPDPCKPEEFKQYLIDTAAKNPEVVEKLEKLTADLGALVKCFPNVPGCKKKS